MKPIPEQYRRKAESLIHQIGKLSDELYPFIQELGDNLEIKCGRCIIKMYRANDNNDTN